MRLTFPSKMFGKHTSGAKAPTQVTVLNAGAEAPAYPKSASACLKSRSFASLRMTTRVAVLMLAVGTMFLAGCRQDMQNQPKIIPQRESVIFADHRSARPQVENTVARGQLHEDSYFYTGTVEGANGYREEKDLLPFPATLTVLQKGQERFNVYCTPCHSRVGNGLGAIVQRGYKPAGNLNDQVRRAQPLSHYFYVMTHGYGAMPDYSAQLSPEERWAVAAYIRALQLSQNATEKDIATGAKVQNLKDIATSKGLPEGFAGPWEMPTTAIQAYPPTGEGTPAMAPGYPYDPKVFVPHSAAPAGKSTNSPEAPAAPKAGN